jgi:hypothetical protein
MDGWMGMQEVDNLTLRRFLRARDHNVDKAGAMLLKFLRWRAEAAPGGSVPEDQVRGELEQDKVYMGGVDRTGRPIIVGFLAKHYSANRDMAEFKSTSSPSPLQSALHYLDLLLHQNACNFFFFCRFCGLLLRQDLCQVTPCARPAACSELLIVRVNAVYLCVDPAIMEI